LGGHNLEHSKSVYFKILLALFLLTLVTVGVSYIDFGSVALGIVVGLLIASFKGLLVAGNFMHLFDEVKSIYWLLILSAIFCIPLYFVPLLWEKDLVTEEKLGPWVGQAKEIRQKEAHSNDESDH
jgi:caa(3)-type oxidase subunit IV